MTIQASKARPLFDAPIVRRAIGSYPEEQTSLARAAAGGK